MGVITVRLAGMTGAQDVQVEVDEGQTATVEQVREAANVPAELGIRSEGQSLSNDAPVRDEQVLVTSPPEAKQGA